MNKNLGIITHKIIRIRMSLHLTIQLRIKPVIWTTNPTSDKDQKRVE